MRAAGCVFAEDEARLLTGTARDAQDLERLIRRRERGEPLETLLGTVQFAGLPIALDSGVFVPRRRTELLAREAARHARPGGNVLDLCCGSGAVGAYLAARTAATVYAADLDPAAVACARRNLDPARVFQGDLFAALPTPLRGSVDVVAANAPYVPTDSIALMPPEAREHEPRHALDGGPDGLRWHRRIAAEAPPWLRPGGVLLIETSRHQADRTLAVLARHGFDARTVRDAAIDATVAVGIRRGR